MPALGLRHTKKRCDLRKDHLQRTAVAQHEKKELGSRLAQRALGLLPDPFRYERVNFTAAHHLLHQGARLRSYRESAVPEACGESRHAQHTHRVLDEGLRDVAQDTLLQVIRAAVGVDEFTAGTLCDGIDRKIAPAQILLQRHIGREAGAEAAIARRDFGFQAGKRVFLFGLRMQKDRELAPYGEIAELLEILRPRTDDYPVALARGDAEELIADGTADQVDLHARNVNREFRPNPHGEGHAPDVGSLLYASRARKPY